MTEQKDTSTASLLSSMIYAATQGSAEEEEAAELVVGTSTPRSSWVRSSSRRASTSTMDHTNETTQDPSSYTKSPSSEPDDEQDDPIVEHDGFIHSPTDSKESTQNTPVLDPTHPHSPSLLTLFWNSTVATTQHAGNRIWQLLVKPMSSIQGSIQSAAKNGSVGGGPYNLRRRKVPMRPSGGLVHSTSTSDFSTTDPESDASSTTSTTHRQRQGLSHRQHRLDHRTQHPRNSKSSLYKQPSLLPKKQKTLVLDLDETLIHSTSRGSRRYDHVIEVLIDKHICLYYVYKRPHVDYFLDKVSQWYKVVVFTASMAEYADPVMDYLDKRGTLFQGRYFRESCTQVNGTYVKNLALLEPDLSQICLVDNSPVSYACNQDNGIPIQGWTHEPDDVALLDLLPFLDALRFCHDVRSILSLRI